MAYRHSIHNIGQQAGYVALSIAKPGMTSVGGSPPGRVRSQSLGLPEPKADSLLWMLAILIGMYVWRMHGFVPVLAKMKLAVIFMAIAMLVWFSDRHPARRLELIKGPLSKTSLGLLVMMFLGIPTSLVSTKSAMFVITEALPNFLLLMLVACSVRGLRDMEWLVAISLLGATVFALDRITVRTLGFYDRNDLATVLVCHVPIAVYFLRPGVRGLWKLLGATGLICIVLALVKGQSRGGFLGLMLVSIYVLLMYRTIPARTRLLSVAVGATVLFIAASEKFWDRMSTLLTPEEDYN
ncbi:MAG: hypothetical protein ACR2G6_03895, partial [Gemmatimonadaceae bacterium]